MKFEVKTREVEVIESKTVERYSNPVEIVEKVDNLKSKDYKR